MAVLTIAAIPDIHVPAHDPIAVDLTRQWLESREIHAIVQLGDLVDHVSISRFVKDIPGKLIESRLADEWAIARNVTTSLVRSARKRNRSALYFQLEGNHETRLKHLEERHPYLHGLFDLPRAIGVEDLGGRYVLSDSEAEVLRFEFMRKGLIVPVVRRPSEPMTELRFGASFVHGWRFGMHNAKQHAELAPWPGPILFGHTHTIQQFTGDQWGLDHPIGISCGWLGLPFPEYVTARGKTTRWAQGFGVVEIDDSAPGLVNAYALRIVRDRLIADGRSFVPKR